MKKEELPHPIIQKKVEKSLDLSIKEGACASVSAGLGATYFSPFILAMNATSSQVGILFAIVNLLPSIIQLKAARLIQKFSRKSLSFYGVLARAILLLPILLTGLMFYFGFKYAVWFAIFLMALFYSLSGITYPAWFSWMGSLVPEKTRGKYFSKRNRVIGFFGILTMIVSSFILDFFKKTGLALGKGTEYTLFGFGVLFLIAFFVRLLSLKFLKEQYEPKIKIRKKDYFSFWQFLKNARQTAFGRFSFFKGFFSLAIGIAGPFWTVYMLRNLGFSYFWFMAVTVSGVFFQLTFLPILGKFSDKFGNIKLMRFCASMIVIVPALWMISAFIPNPKIVKLYLLTIPSIIGGIAWAGYALASNNYVYDAVSQQKRSFGVAYMNLLTGIGMFLGAVIGSAIAHYNFQFIDTLLFIFALSAIMRLIVVWFGLKNLKEVRHVEKFNTHFLIHEFRPMQGITRELHHLGHLVEIEKHKPKKLIKS